MAKCEWKGHHLLSFLISEILIVLADHLSMFDKIMLTTLVFKTGDRLKLDLGCDLCARREWGLPLSLSSTGVATLQLYTFFLFKIFL